MKKRFTAALLTAVLVSVVLAGCKQNVGSPEDNAVVEEQEETEEDEKEPEMVLGYSCSDLSNPFYTVLKEAVQSYLEEEGGRLIARDAESDAALQNRQVNELIGQDVEAVFL